MLRINAFNPILSALVGNFGAGVLLERHSDYRCGLARNFYLSERLRLLFEPAFIVMKHATPRAAARHRTEFCFGIPQNVHTGQISLKMGFWQLSVIGSGSTTIALPVLSLGSTLTLTEFSNALI